MIYIGTYAILGNFCTPAKYDNSTVKRGFIYLERFKTLITYFFSFDLKIVVGKKTPYINYHCFSNRCLKK